MLDDVKGEQPSFSVIKPDQGGDFYTPFFGSYDDRAFSSTAVTSIGLEMHRAIASANILHPEEKLLTPDYYAFVVFPLPPDAKPGIEREYTPTISRTTTDSLGPQLARGVLDATEKQIKEWEQQGVHWRWITLESPQPDSPLQSLFIQHHVDSQKGEGLRFLAYGGKSSKPISTPKLPTGVK